MIKIHNLLIKPFIIASLMISTFALADETQSVMPDSAESVTSEEECGIDLLPPIKPTTKGDVSYVSGGVCLGGVDQMKSMAKNFQLEVVLVEKNEAYTKENYIADVKVKINDLKDNTILDVVTEGPFLLANLPIGHYQIIAEYNGVVKTRKVNIRQNKHERVVFLWPQLSESE
jgi:hypothetical protein